MKGWRTFPSADGVLDLGQQLRLYPDAFVAIRIIKKGPASRGLCLVEAEEPYRRAPAP